jgi:outer membrane receptor protein involved in Fe transport
VQTSLALWILTQESELLFVGDAGTVEPSRASRREGIEWITSYRPLKWLLFDFELSLAKGALYQHGPARSAAGHYIPGAIPVTALRRGHKNLGPWSAAFELRYFSAYPLIEDDSVRSNPSTLVNLRGGYQFDKTWKLQLDVLNLFNSSSNDITYYYASCPPNQIGSAGCPVGGGGQGVNDIHFHPTEPRQFRLTLMSRF